MEIEDLKKLKDRLEVLKEKKTKTEAELEHNEKALVELKDQAKSLGLNFETLESDLQKCRESYLKLKDEVEKDLDAIEKQLKSAEI